MSQVAPMRYFGAVLYLTVFVVCVNAQDYLSQCEPSQSNCAKDKFLSCTSNKCQCADILNQVYDDQLDTCVIKVGRTCAGILNSAELLDPRRLENVKTFPTCGTHAVCDSDTSVCTCKNGYFHNELDGICQLSFGKSCSSRDNIVFQSPDDTLPETTTGISETISSDGCDKSLGLQCGSEGICKCMNGFVWKIGKGCFQFNESSKPSSTKSEFANYQTRPGNNYINSNPAFNYQNYGVDEQPPFQQFVDSYIKALIDANNYYENSNNYNAELMGTRYNNSFTSITSSGEKNSSEKGNQYLVGDRNEFPGSNGINTNQNDQLWNLLLQQELEKNNNANLRNNLSGSNEELLKIQDQALQLQKLLLQQQQLERLLNQVLTPATGNSQIQPNQNVGGFATPSPILAPSNNILGAGVPQPQYQYQGNVNTYPTIWNQPQPPSLFSSLFPFPFFRFFRNFLEPFKRRMFPNLADSGYTFPSPIYLAASAVKGFLPVLRALDQQFAPVLENVITLTKPRPRPTPAPLLYTNNNLLQQLLQWNNNNRLAVPNGQQQLQLPSSAFSSLLAQRLLVGNGLRGLNGMSTNNRGSSGRSLNPSNADKTRLQRRGRFWNAFTRNDSSNRVRNVRRGLWWW